MIVSYSLVPCLFSPSVSGTPQIGDSTTISYRINDSWYLTCFRIPFTPDDMADAFRTCDYLLVTSPERLFGANPPATHNDVYRLIATMARLAKEKSGVLGFMPRDWNQFELKDALNHTWGNSLTSTYKSSGYLLLVGQDDIVPAWNTPVEHWGIVRLSDYLYSNLSGDGQCELRVGRIIGLTAAELTIPIQTSLDVWRGTARYDGSRGMMVSAAEGPFEWFVMWAVELSDSLRRKVRDVFCVLGERFITRMNMLREALWIDCDRDLYKLSRWTLREWLWNGHTLGTIDQLSEIDRMSRTAVQDSAIALARRLIREEDRPANDTDLVVKALEQILPWEDFVPRRNEYVRALAQWLLQQRGVIPPADTIGRALRVGEEIQYARRGQRLPVYNYYDTPGDAARDRSSLIRSIMMAQGPDIIDYIGHGGPGSWWWTLDDWRTSSCPAEPLSFGSHRPVVLGHTCSSGDYTERGEHGPVSIARCFLRNGAGIYVGATRVSFCCTNYTLYHETFRHWSTREHFGDAFVGLKNTTCLREHDWILETIMYNLYGDPKYRRR
ncbi:MAG: C25 family cysteine peptidase [bacterium]